MKNFRFWSILLALTATTSNFGLCCNEVVAANSLQTSMQMNGMRANKSILIDNHVVYSDTVGDVTRGLLAYYNFDNGTANNAAGLQNNGVINGAALFVDDTPNGKGKALFLDQEQFVNVARNPLKGKESYTVSLWVKNFGAGYLFSTGANDRYSTPSLFINTEGKIGISYVCTPFNYYAKSLQTSGWHMLTLVQTGEEYELYVDGNIVDNINDRASVEGNKMQIGGRNDMDYVLPWTDPFKVDNVRIYGVALTEEEVGKLYHYEKK